MCICWFHQCIEAVVCVYFYSFVHFIENISDHTSDVTASKCRKETKIVATLYAVPLSWGEVLLKVLELN
jgi:hypothetical protein